jgi:transposase
MRLKGIDAKTYRWQTIVTMWAEGKKQEEIGRQLKISQSSVSRVINMYLKDGGAVPKKHKGAACRLSDAQKSMLSTMLEEGSVAHGFEGERWTNKRIALIIMDKFGIKYGERQITKIVHDLGFTRQRPRTVDKRQDPVKVAEWKGNTLPNLKKKRLKKTGQ